MAELELTLEEAQSKTGEPNAAAPVDIPQEALSDYDSLPDHEQAAARKALLSDILQGVKPEHAAAARGIPVKVLVEPVLASLIRRCEAHAISVVESVVFARVVSALPIAAPMWYWLEARAGYDRKTRDDGLPQEVSIERRTVKGDQVPE